MDTLRHPARTLANLAGVAAWRNWRSRGPHHARQDHGDCDDGGGGGKGSEEAPEFRTGTASASAAAAMTPAAAVTRAAVETGSFAAACAWNVCQAEAKAACAARIPSIVAESFVREIARAPAVSAAVTIAEIVAT